MRNIILIYIVVNDILMGKEFFGFPSQEKEVEPDLREVPIQKTAEPLSYDESELIGDDNELIDEEHEFDADELDADFEYGP
jgi:hypothetical protein